MDEKKGVRFWQWAVLLLVICNIGLIVTMWIKPHPGGPPPGGDGPRERVINDLQLTADQIKQYDALIKEHRQQIDQLKEEGSKLRQLLFTNIAQSGNPGKTADSVAQLIANNQKAIELVTFNHFTHVRAICTDQQKQEFDKILVNITRNMAGNNGDRRPPPPPPGGHDGPPPPPPGNDGPPPPGENLLPQKEGK